MASTSVAVIDDMADMKAVLKDPMNDLSDMMCWHTPADGEGPERVTAALAFGKPLSQESRMIEGAPFRTEGMPLYLPRKILERFVPEGGTVYDPCGCDGTVLIACEDTGRGCVMQEQSPERCDAIVCRFIERTGSADGVTVMRCGEETEADWSF